MAAQARPYDKNISYSSRQVDEKYLPKNHRHNIQSNSRESSPYRIKSNNYQSSPNGRKRSFDSPSSTSSKHSNSPYEIVRKKERLINNSIPQPKDSKLNDGDWSQHVSSTGKVYYYNKRTEDSQWEVPKDWTEKQNKEPVKNNHLPKDNLMTKDQRNDRNGSTNNNKDIREKNYKVPPDKNVVRDYRLRDYREQEQKQKSYRDRNTRDNKDFRESSRSNNRDRDNKDRDKDCRDRDRDTRDYRDYIRDYSDNKYRSSSNSLLKRDTKYNSSSSIKTVGQCTPSSATSTNRSSRGTPDEVNGTLQDISPPGTPTNDDIMNISSISPAPLYTPRGCSPLLNSSLSSSIIQLPATPILSPIVINTRLPTPFLHPLQQALLLQQQQISPIVISGSPKLPTVKNHLTDTGSASSSPKLSTSFQFKSSQHSPVQLLRTSNSTPPPPPPPLKEQHHNSESRDRERSVKLDRFSRNNSSFDSRDSYSSRDSVNRSKSYDERTNDITPLKPHHKSSEMRNNSDRLNKKLQKAEPDVLFTELPNLDKYSYNYSATIVDFTNGSNGNMLDKQISTTWEETMGFLHSDGFRSKFDLLMSKHESDLQESKFDVSSNWSDALNIVLDKVESLLDSSMKSSDPRAPRDYRSSPVHRKSKFDASANSSSEPKENGILDLSNDVNSNGNNSQTMNDEKITS